MLAWSRFLWLTSSLWFQRLDFVAGKVEPTEEESTLEDDEEDEAAQGEGAADETPVKGIPQFWSVLGRATEHPTRRT